MPPTPAPDRLDGAGALVAEDERQRHRPLAVDGVQVGVADAARAVAHAAPPPALDPRARDVSTASGEWGACSTAALTEVVMGSAASHVRSGPCTSETTLPGGLRVISETIESVRSVAVGVFVGVGARDERPPRGRRHAPDRASAVQGQRALRPGRDRARVRSTGLRAQRLHDARIDGRARARAGRAPAAGARRHVRHGRAPALRGRRARVRARGRARGDRDDRGRSRPISCTTWRRAACSATTSSAGP